MRVRRLLDEPIIRPHMDERMGSNINGPSLIRAPDWLIDPLGAYYLYFADHQGSYIRLAYADSLEGPWHMHTPGVLSLADSGFPERVEVLDPVPDDLRRRLVAAGIKDNPFVPHIASPDVHVIDERREIRMYFHGMLPDRTQMTRVAVSTDGLKFTAADELLGPSYFRAFNYSGHVYAMAMPGVFYRSLDGLTGFEQGPTLFTVDMRHAALRIIGDSLEVFWTRVGDTPEHILCSQVELGPDWRHWSVGETRDMLFPEREWEGADLPVEASVRGAIVRRARQLRDPCLFSEGDRTYLLYAGAGESCIGLGELVE